MIVSLQAGASHIGRKTLMKTKTLAAVVLLLWAGATCTALQLTTPCRTEDSTLCYWNGDTRGNKTGYSFIALTETLQIRTK